MNLKFRNHYLRLNNFQKLNLTLAVVKHLRRRIFPNIHPRYQKYRSLFRNRTDPRVFQKIKEKKTNKLSLY